MRCQDIMTPNPRHCTEQTTAQGAALIMDELNVGIVPVLDEQSKMLLGVVTDRDLCRFVVAQNQIPGETLVADCMTDDPVTCSPTDEVEVAEELMKTHQIRRVPVVDEEGRCVGIIAQSDLAVRVDEPSVTHEVVRKISTE